MKHRIGLAGQSLVCKTGSSCTTMVPDTWTYVSPRKTQERMLKEGKAEPHQFAPQAGWVTYRIRSDEDLETAKELIKLAYDNARKAVASILQSRLDLQKPA